MKKFELVPELATADICFKAYGKDMNEAFENAALAMFEIITNTKQIKEEIKKEIKIESEDLHALLFDFLSELLFLHDSEHLVFRRFNLDIKKTKKGHSLHGVVYGCRFNEKIERRGEVKAVTYYRMEIKEEKDKAYVQVVLDM